MLCAVTIASGATGGYTAVLNASTLGIDEITDENIVSETVGTRATYQHETTRTTVQQAAGQGQGGIYDELVEGVRDILDGSKKGFAIERILQVRRVEPVYANVETTSYVTTKTITFTAPEDLRSLTIIELPSRAITDSTVAFDDDPTTSYDDGYVWNTDALRQDQTVNVTYHVNNLVVGDEGTKLVAFGDPVAQTRRERVNTTTTKPEEARTKRLPRVLRGNLATTLLSISGGLIIFLLACILVFELETKGKLDSVHDFGRDIYAIARVGFRNKRLIESYIQDCVDQGFHTDDIHINLIRAGWNRSAVRTLLKKYQ